MLRRSAAVFLLAALLVPVLLAVGPSADGQQAESSGNGSTLTINATPVFSSTDQAQFTFQPSTPISPPAADAEPSSACTGTVAGVPGATVTFSGYATGTVTFPAGTPGGVYELEVTCPASMSGAGPSEATTPTVTAVANLAFAQVTVDKVVEGDPPADAQFVVNLDCSLDAPPPPPPSPGAFAETEGFPGPDSLVLDLTFAADGGTQQVVLYGPYTCTVTEPDDAGALSVTVVTADCGERRPIRATEATSGDFSVYEPTDCTQTVTNVFDDAVVDDDVVAATPPFTG